VGSVGFDAGKRVKGRKRHLAVDSLGYPMAVVVTGAQVQDSQPAGAALLLVRLRQMLERAKQRLGHWPKLREVTGDGNYRGTAHLWAKQMGFALRNVERTGGKGFEKLPKRWVVERTFAWLFNFKRLLFDREYKIENSEGMIWLAGITLMLNRIWPRPAS
jgi:putative transposase